MTLTLSRARNLAKVNDIPTVTLVIPCYNEAARFDQDAFEAAAREAKSLTLLFVDDGSTDNTRNVLQKLCARLPERMSCLALDSNQGKAEAVRQGMLRAFDADSRYVGYWDADLSTPLSEWPPMCELAETFGAQVVFGSRVKLLGRRIDRKAARHYLSRVFATVTSCILGLSVYDTQCGAKVFRSCPSNRELFAHPFISRWIFDVEIVARLLMQLRDAEDAPDEERRTSDHSERSGCSLGAEKRRGDKQRQSRQSRFQSEAMLVEYPLQQWVHAEGSKLKLRDFARATLELAQIADKLHRTR